MLELFFLIVDDDEASDVQNVRTSLAQADSAIDLVGATKRSRQVIRLVREHRTNCASTLYPCLYIAQGEGRDAP
jgi:hypothetical protein